MKNRNYKASDETIDADVTNIDIAEDIKTEKKKEPKKTITQGEVIVPNLALRMGPGTNYDKIGMISNGVVELDKIENNFGRLTDGSGWVCMDYVLKVN